MTERLIEAIKVIFNHTYKSYGTVTYATIDPSHMLVLGQYPRNLDIRVGLYRLPREAIGGYKYMSLTVDIYYRYDRCHIMNLTIQYPEDIMGIPEPLEVFRDNFHGAESRYIQNNRAILIIDYQEDTTFVDTILSSTPEELELYLRLL